MEDYYMKKRLSLLLFLLLVTACNQQSNDGMYQTNEARQTPRGTEYDSNQMARGYGYSRHTYEEMQQNNDHAGALVVNRDMLAEGISRMLVDNRSINEAAVLITDKYALAVYEQQDDGQPENLVADQVKRSVMASIPSFYEVYVSNDPSHIKEIARYENVTAGSKEYAWMIKETIEEMKTRPQGNVDIEMDKDMDIMRKKQEELRQGN